MLSANPPAIVCATSAARREVLDPDNNGMLPPQGSFHDVPRLLGRNGFDVLAKAEKLAWCGTPVYGECLVHGDRPGVSDDCGSRH